MQKIKHIFNVLLNIGVKPEFPLAERTRIQNMNRLCLISGSVALSMTPLLYDSIPAVIGVIMYSICLYSIFFFHFIGKYNAFNLFITLSLGALNIFFAAGFDKRMGIEVHFIVTFVAILHHFHDHKHRPFDALFTAFTFLVAMYMQFFNIHFFKAPRLAPYIFFTNTIAGLWFLYLTIVRFRNILRKSQEEINQKNELLERKTQELESSNNIKDKLFSIVGHDLRAPLASINGFLTLLEADLLDEETKTNYIQKLRSAISGSSETLDNLVSWYKQQNQHITPIKESIHLVEVIETIFNTLNILAEQKKITLKHEIPNDLQVESDPNFLPFIVRNLVSNALKFTPKGGVVSIETQNTNDNEILILIKDTGMGIKPENLNKLFDSNAHFSTLGTEKEKGTGLGLPLCKELAEKNGSRLWVESEEGKGSTFYFSLPLRLTT